jgi:2-polyprenyl-6-methoxyphenol hydroxylase-like FAD-dependent oxidoreductase
VRQRHHAIVIGASMGGLATARVLADHFDAVTIVDRDSFSTELEQPTELSPRKGVPQGRHAHALLAGGARAIEGLFPGIIEEFNAAGAAALDFNDGSWYQAGGYRARSLIERVVVSASRPFIEGHVRRRVRALPNVSVEADTTVHGLVHDGDRVRGVRIDQDGTERTLLADLVVDCSGRASSAPRWLEAIGFPAPQSVEVRCDVRYGTVVLRRTANDIDGTFAVIIGSPPDEKRAAFLLPVEHDRWILTIAASFGETAPVDEATFHAIAAELPSPEIAEVLRRAEPLGPVMTHRLPSSRRYRYEQLKKVPVGFLALGDSICSFNPVYGQGMSSAVLQAVALGETLAGGDDIDLERRFYKRAAKVIANPWKIAVGADFAYPECTGPKPPGTDLVNRYMKRVLLAARVSPEVNTAMIMVQNLLAPPSVLMKPAMIRTVVRASRAATRQAGNASPRPTEKASGLAA